MPETAPFFYMMQENPMWCHNTLGTSIIKRQEKWVFSFKFPLAMNP